MCVCQNVGCERPAGERREKPALRGADPSIDEHRVDQVRVDRLTRG
jgi:hypothetical protein